MAKAQRNALQVRFGRLIGAHRRFAGLSQAELADRSGLGVDTISKLETGLTGASFATIERISAALSVDPAQLFSHELGGQPFERRALTDFVSQVAHLPEPDLRWLTDIVISALKPRN